MKRFSVLLLVGLLTALTILPAAAISNPDSLLWTKVVGYADTVEDGDFLVIGTYDIGYLSTPVEAASDTFLASVSFGGNLIQSDGIIPYNDNGYGQGIVSFYFTADESTALSLATTGTWEVTLQGSPASFPSPLSVTTSSITWYAGLVSNLFVTAHIREGAASLEAAWTADGDVFDLLDGSLLAADGEDYFEQVIPNLRQIAPKLFGGSVGGASFQEFEETFTQDERTTRRNILAGTSLDANLIAIENEWRIPWEISAAILFYTGVAGLSVLYMKTPRAKTEFVFMIFLVATPFGAYGGMVDMVFAALVAFGASALIVYFVSWRGAN